MCSSEARPIVGLDPLLEVAFGLFNEEAGFGTASAAEHGVWDNST